MSGQDIAYEVVNKLEGIDWNSIDNSLHRFTAMTKVAEGILKYMNDNWSITATAIGLTTASPPVPLGDTPECNLILGQATALSGFLMSMTNGAKNLVPFFSALTAWLSTPPWPIIVTKGITLAAIAGAGIVTFPTMTSMAVPCLAQMMGSKPNNMYEAWGIIGTHIYNGLMGNIIPPIPTTAVPPPWSGVTTAILTF